MRPITTVTITRPVTTLVIAAALSLGGCGQMGPLYEPPPEATPPATQEPGPAESSPAPAEPATAP